MKKNVEGKVIEERASYERCQNRTLFHRFTCQFFSYLEAQKRVKEAEEATAALEQFSQKSGT